MGTPVRRTRHIARRRWLYFRCVLQLDPEIDWIENFVTTRTRRPDAGGRIGAVAAAPMACGVDAVGGSAPSRPRRPCLTVTLALAEKRRLTHPIGALIFRPARNVLWTLRRYVRSAAPSAGWALRATPPAPR